MTAATRTYLLFILMMVVGSFGTGFTRALWSVNSTSGGSSLWFFLFLEGFIGISFVRALGATIREDAKKDAEKNEQTHPSREEA